MFITRRVWRFRIETFIVAVLLLIAMAMVGWLLYFAIVNDLNAIKLLAAALCFAVLAIGGEQVGWVQEQRYFYKLWRLLREQMTDKRQYTRELPDGTIYFVTGREPEYTIEWTPYGGAFTYVYHVSDRSVWAESRTSGADESAEGAQLGEHESIDSQPLSFDPWHTFKRLVKDLGAPMPP